MVSRPSAWHPRTCGRHLPLRCDDVNLPHETAEQGDLADGPRSAPADAGVQDAPAAVAEHDPAATEDLISQLGLEPEMVAGHAVDPGVVHLLPEGLVREHLAVPVCLKDEVLVLATCNDPDLALLDQIELVTGHRVEPVEATEKDIRRTIERYFTVDRSFEEGLGDMGRGEGGDPIGRVISLSERLGARRDAPAVRLVDSMLRGAARRGASDIHIEPLETQLLVRYRIDGVLHDMMRVPNNIQDEVISRVKLISALDITEHRAPQDGRISIRMESAEFDMRVSTLLTVNGEKIAIRLLNKSSGGLNLRQLGMPDEQRDLFAKLITRPYGMILLAGPTGSGKTTTLYAALREVDRAHLNVTTIEDPVEYSFDLVNQIQVNPAVGLTFAGSLRTVLRQDPDIIMVGEIRDTETARLAVQAAMTGHLLFSTLHANDSPSVMDRLKDLGVPPFLIASTLVVAISQRLVRRVCPDCAEAYRPPAALVAGTGLEGADLMHGRGCDMCMGTGYRGRMGMYEIFPVNEAIREAFVQGVSSDVLRNLGRETGMITMRDAAIEAVRNGHTTIDELRRILPAEDIES